MQELMNIDIFPVVLTLAAFSLAQFVYNQVKLPLLNPTLMGMVLTGAFLLLFKLDIGVYKEKTFALSWLMTPATICLAIPMYEQLQVLRKHLSALIIGVASGAITCALGLMGCGIALGLSRVQIISLMPKSVTTAIGMPLSELFGGMGGITVAAIIVTGIGANMMSGLLFKAFRITNPIAQGVALGTSGHVIGTAKASELGELTGAASSLSLVVAGLMTAVIFPLLVKLF